ncbi:UNVERIFIED_CONTAM: hypothetical protein PYX00_011325 [Menopon gallinae]|uniref:Small ribosomal subunit protein eS7 n=1 Tax=Menopon gallinae TaxID=328185 RepID=A0AAW2H7D0_9NEOP
MFRDTSMLRDTLVPSHVPAHSHTHKNIATLLMKQIEKLINAEDYDSILKLEGREYDEYKCVTLIKLEKHKEALMYAKPLSFELAYINYRLKRFKKCLKLINKNTNNKELRFQFLKAQTLYNLGRYNDAYNVLRVCPLDDEVVINLEAMRSMASIAACSDGGVPAKCSLMKKDEPTKFGDFSNYRFKDDELEEEFRYNQAFSHVLDEQKYLNVLRELSESHRHGVIKRQLDNLLGHFDDIDKEKLRSSDCEILQFNRGDLGSFRHPAHYQHNFVDTKGRFWPLSDYYCYKKASELGYDVGDAVIPRASNNLLLLRAFLELKKMFRGERFSRRFFEKRDSTAAWTIVEFLSMKKAELETNRSRLLSFLYSLAGMAYCSQAALQHQDTADMLTLRMSEQTEHEKKVAQEIRKLYSQDMSGELGVKLRDIRIQTIDRDQGKKILLIRVPEEVLEVVHAGHSKLSGKLRALYPDFHTLVIRNTPIVDVASTKGRAYRIDSKNMKRHVHEAWIRDLCYPALVEMRKTDVFNGSERIESALVSSNSNYSEDDFSAMECAFKTLTGRAIHYGNIFY